MLNLKNTIVIVIIIFTIDDSKKTLKHAFLLLKITREFIDINREKQQQRQEL